MFLLGVQIDTVQTVPMTVEELNAATLASASHGEQIEIQDTLVQEEHL